ncbi:MAG: hypothetical protein PWQ82_1499 [Thermosediminibacterales bacterium]|nr:hypothetical protein [Thermosediminibacterales bacterium]
MENKSRLTKFITFIGTVLVWLPIFFTIVTSIVGTVLSHTFRFDYLMPAELFPIALMGGLLLLWAAKRAQLNKGPIGWGLVAMTGFLITSQVVAVVTGLAHGEHEPTGWRVVMVLALLALFVLANIVLGIMGIRLFRKL